MPRCDGCCDAVGLPAGPGSPVVAAALTPAQRAADTAYPAPWMPPAGRAVLQPDLRAAAAMLDGGAVDLDTDIRHPLTIELPRMIDYPSISVEELTRLPATGACVCGWQTTEPCDMSLRYPHELAEQRRVRAALQAAHGRHLAEVAAALAATHRHVRLTLYQIRTIDVDVWLPDAAAERVAARAVHVDLDVDQAPVEIGELFHETPSTEVWDLESWGVVAGGIAEHPPVAVA
jgi:hypothetical protein